MANHKFFLLFLFYVSSLCGFAVVLVTLRFVSCVSGGGGSSVAKGGAVGGTAATAAAADGSCRMGSGAAIATLGLVVLAVLFGIFTLCMICDQYPALQDGMTMIDRHHARDRAGANAAAIRTMRRSAAAARAETFGGRPSDGFRWHWLLPIAVSYPDPESITGYCLRESPIRNKRLIDGLGSTELGGAGVTSDGEDEAIEDDVQSLPDDSRRRV
jgi:hypothetical protein